MNLNRKILVSLLSYTIIFFLFSGVKHLIGLENTLILMLTLIIFNLKE